MAAQPPTDSMLLVSSTPARNLDFFDARTGAKLATIDDLVAEPHEITLDTRRRLAYIAHTYRTGGYNEGTTKGHEVSVVDIDRREVVDVIDIAPFMGPHDVEYDVLRDVVYAGVERVDGRNGVVVIDCATRDVVDNILVDAANSHWMALRPDCQRLYVSHKEGEHLSVIDLTTRAVANTISVPGGAEEVDCSSDGRWLFVNTPRVKVDRGGVHGQIWKWRPLPGEVTPRILKIDTATDIVVASLDVDQYCSALRATGTGLLLASQGVYPDRPRDDEPAALNDTASGPRRLAGNLLVIDIESMSMAGVVQVGTMPFTVRASGDGATAYVANLGDGTVSVVDLATMALTGELANNPGMSYGGTHGMCWVPGRD